MKFIFVILCLVLVSNECLAQKCTEDYMLSCVSDTIAVLQQALKTIETGEDFTIYCPTIEQHLECLKDCEADFPKVSESIQIIDFQVTEFCGENGKMNVDMIPCFESNSALFEQCERDIDSPEVDMCNLVDSMLCIARFSKKKCENGKAYGNALEKRMMKRLDTCNGAGHLANSFLIFATTVLSPLLIRNRLQ